LCWVYLCYLRVIVLGVLVLSDSYCVECTCVIRDVLCWVYLCYQIVIVLGVLVLSDSYCAGCTCANR